MDAASLHKTIKIFCHFYLGLDLYGFYDIYYG